MCQLYVSYFVPLWTQQQVNDFVSKEVIKTNIPQESLQRGMSIPSLNKNPLNAAGQKRYVKRYWSHIVKRTVHVFYL